MADLRVGLVGCGGIGGVHARSWAKVEGAQIAAACDADLGRAESVGGAAYSSYKAMLDEAELDAVDICTPPNLHLEVAAAALERGLPVLCEKPLARNPQEAREMVAASVASGALLMTAFCHRFHPPVEFVRGLIERGELGRILMSRNRFGGLLAGMEKKWFSNAEIAGGGALMDTAVHSVDLFRYLVGEVETATAAVNTFHPEIRGLEDSGAMLLRAENGAVGVIEASWVTPWSANVIEIYGEKGAAVIDYDTGQTRYRLAGAPEWATAETPGEDRFAAELRHFAGVIRGEEQPRMTGTDGLRAIEIIHEAYGNALGHEPPEVQAATDPTR
jgi:predicted dehydrogenase